MKYFLHDTNSFQDEKITELFIAHGYEGLGLFYTILEKLANQEKPIKTIVLKRQLSVGKKLEKVWSFLEEIELIYSKNGETFNENVLKFSENYQTKKEKTKERVAKWRENQAVEENVTRYNDVRNTPKDNISKDNISKESINVVDAHEAVEISSQSQKADASTTPPPTPPSNYETSTLTDSYSVYQAGYLSDRQLMETSQMVLKIPEGKVIEFLALFTAEQRGLQKSHADITEFKKHAYAWIRIQVEKSQKYGKPKNPSTIPSGPKIPVPVTTTNAPTGRSGNEARSGFNRRVTG
jgi:hypothetical protein